MKKLLFIVITIMFFACGQKNQDIKITYDITYTDGTKERVVLDDELAFSDNGDCISTCGCSSQTFKRCGVRKFDMVSTAPVIVADTSNKQNTLSKAPQSINLKKTM